MTPPPWLAFVLGGGGQAGVGMRPRSFHGTLDFSRTSCLASLPQTFFPAGRQETTFCGGWEPTPRAPTLACRLGPVGPSPKPRKGGGGGAPISTSFPRADLCLVFCRRKRTTFPIPASTRYGAPCWPRHAGREVCGKLSATVAKWSLQDPGQCTSHQMELRGKSAEGLVGLLEPFGWPPLGLVPPL